jgi:putative aldouronate transport system permease protein
MIWPGVILLLIFHYRTFYWLILAFKDYDVVTGFDASPWVGLKHFVELFTDPGMIRAVRNSIGINVLQLLIQFPAPIIFAVLLNEISHTLYKRVTQTISYVPHFVSWVIFGGLVIKMIAPDGGPLNVVLQSLGVVEEPVFFIAKPQYFWMIAVISGTLKEFGWGSIIYIAAISGVDPQLYDSAIVDGANRFQRVRHITIPSISLTIVIMLIFQVSKLMKTGFDQIWMLQNPFNVSASETIETYTYKIGIENLRFSYATAVGLCLSLISIILLLTANFISKRVTEQSLF